jgi:hypothetical protein
MKLAVVITLIVVGVIVGVSLTSFNPWINPAEARRMDMLTEAEQNNLALDFQLRETQVQYEQERLNLQLAYEREVAQQDLRHRQAVTERIMLVITWIGAALSLAVIIYSVNLILPKAVAALKTIFSLPSRQEATSHPAPPPKDYYHELLEVKHENRELKNRNQYLNEVNQRLASFCQLLATENEVFGKESFDLDTFILNMKKHRDPAKKMKGGYTDNPLAGD